MDIKKINDLIDISRQKTFRIEQLKNNTYNELGFTFKPAISESSKYRVSGTFEERNFINYYPNRESLLSKKKYGNSNKEVSSILSYCNKDNNINNNKINNFNDEFDSASKLSIKTLNYNSNSNNNYMNNKENSFSSSKQSSLKSKWIGNPNKRSTPILNSSSKKRNNFSNSKTNPKIDDNVISYNDNNNHNDDNSYKTSISNNININNNNNRTRSIKSSICNFSTAKNTPDLRNNHFITKIANESLINQVLKSNADINCDDSNKEMIGNENYNNKKNTKLQETRNIVKRINSKVKSLSNKDFEFLDKTTDQVYNTAVLENASKKNLDKNSNFNSNNNHNDNNDNNDINSNYESASRNADESKNNNFHEEEGNINLNNRENRNKNYGNIVYSVKSNENANKFIKNERMVSYNNDMNNQENSRFDYSMSKTDGEVYFEK